MAQVITVDEIQEGMLLAAPVTNRYGQVMLPAKTELKERHKRTLTLWGISTVTVTDTDDTDEETTEEMTMEIRQMVAERLSKRLRWKPRNPYEQNMVQMIINHLIAVCKKEIRKR